MSEEKPRSEKSEQEVEKFYTALIFLFMFNFFLVLTLLFGAAIYLKIIPLHYLIFYVLLVVLSLIFLPKMLYTFFNRKEKKQKQQKP